MDQDTIVQLLGRLHPLLLHMPIGLWFGVVALEFGGAMIRRTPARATLATLAWMAAVGGALQQAAAGSSAARGIRATPSNCIVGSASAQEPSGSSPRALLQCRIAARFD